MEHRWYAIQTTSGHENKVRNLLQRKIDGDPRTPEDRTIRQALRPDGIYVCLEINCSDKLEENIHPVGALFYGFSVLLCLTQSLAEHGEGLGTMGLPESKLRELSTEAGFGSVRRVPMDNPFNSLYEIRVTIGGV